MFLFVVTIMIDHIVYQEVFKSIPKAEQITFDSLPDNYKQEYHEPACLAMRRCLQGENVTKPFVMFAYPHNGKIYKFELAGHSVVE